jgi:diguanylate cyclase (GGDEF)-like protein
MLVNVLDAQTGVRGFVITHDEAFLEPYRHAIDEHASILARGRQAWPEGTTERATLERFTTLFETYRKDIAEPVVALERRILSANGGDDAARERLESILGSGRDKALVDQMKRLVRDLIDRVRAQVADHTQMAQLRQRNAQLVAIVGAPLAVLLGMVLVGAVVGRIRRGLRTLATAAARVAEGDFSQRVELADSREMAHVSHGFNRMAGRLAERQRQGALLDRLTRALQGCQDSEEAFTVAEGYVSKMLSNTTGAVAVYRSSRDHLTPAFRWPAESGRVDADHAVFDPDDCLSLRSGYPYHFARAEGDPACRHFPLGGAEEGLCIPMMDRGEALGVLSLEPLEGTAVDEQTRQLATVLAETLSLSVGNLRLREALRSQSIRDPLTGLYNRRFLDETLDRELSRSRRTGHPLSLVVFDIDHFKRFNDNWGHDAGDAVLVTLANAMREQAREMDLVCRLGGEEFIVVLPRTSLDDALLVAERMREIAATMPIRHRGQLLEGVTISLGVAAYPGHADQSEALIREADQALYRAKRGGRDRVESA